jgi:hypothetical protein
MDEPKGTGPEILFLGMDTRIRLIGGSHHVMKKKKKKKKKNENKEL